jgi:DNA polymerase-3 subunit epsilon
MLKPEDVLHALMAVPIQRTGDLPDNAVGIYALADHEGRRSYIGCTSADNETFRKRIHQRHRTGSETHSHYFARIYNIGRMWRDRVGQQEHPDAKIAKRLRNAFIASHCRAVCVAVEPNVQDIFALEAAVIRLAPPEMCAWNGKKPILMQEPAMLVEAQMNLMRFSDDERAAVRRQAERWSKYGS